MSTHHPRDKYGITCTFESAGGGLLTLHRTGRPSVVLAQMCDDVAAADDTYRIVSYSTPETILRDLTGGTRAHDTRPGLVATPEQGALRRAGRSPMLHPRMRPRRDSARARELYG